MTRNEGLLSFLKQNFETFKNNKAFVAFYNSFVDDVQTCFESSIQASADNTGYSMEKVATKSIACQTAATLCGSAQVQAEILHNQILFHGLNSTLTYYFGQSDSVSLARLQASYNVMEANLELITSVYLTEDQLIDFQKKIVKFSTSSGTSSNVNRSFPTLTAKFVSDLKVTGKDILTAKKLVPSFKLSAPLFYAGVLVNCKIPPINVHHTTVIFMITNSITAAFLSHVSGSIDKKPNELLHSDKDGCIVYTKVKAGDAIATFRMIGFNDKIEYINIEIGKTNTFYIEMLPIEVAKVE